jgi:hypothetical protein
MQPGNTPVPDSQRENVPFWFDPFAAGTATTAKRLCRPCRTG